MASGAPLGRAWAAGVPPGIYERLAAPEPVRDVRLDVAAFIGLTERGPVATAVGVGSWSEYAAWFGRTGGGRQLPDAVRLFFANGGRQAVVVRATGPGASTARYKLDAAVTAPGGDPVQLTASDPGLWGDGLALGWRWVRAPLPVQPDDDLELPAAAAPPVGAALRHTVLPPAPAPLADAVRFVVERAPRPGGKVRLVLDAPLPPVPPGGRRSGHEELRGWLTVRWADLVEEHVDVALDPAHPRWLGAVLEEASRLVRLAAPPAARLVPVAGLLLSRGGWAGPFPGARIASGSDGPSTTSREIFFQAPATAGWTHRPAPLDALAAWDDAHETEPVSMVALPDLLHVRPVLKPEPPDLVDDDLRFGECAPIPDPGTAPAELDWPLLADPSSVAASQQRALEHVERHRRILLLDLPPDLDAGGILSWRRALASDRAVALAPYLRLQDGDLVRVHPPCGPVAGLIAGAERQVGVHASPGNRELFGVLGVHADPLLPAPGFLHEERIDLLRLTERGLRLMGSRTTSLDPDWTHLGVRRLVDWLARQLVLDARWAVFEPNDGATWRRIVSTVQRRLAALGAAGAWAGAGPSDSWFVRCDEQTTTPSDRDAGRLVVQVGVAPSVPAEFVVFELRLQTRDGAVDG